MEALAAALTPEVLGPAASLLLIAASFFTSAMTAGFGVGGGLALMALMGVFLPVAALIPVHGVVQLGSNAGRAALLRVHVDRGFLLAFLPGACLGAAVGGSVVVALPETLLKIVLAGFVLALVWGPKPSAGRGLAGPWGAAGGGAVTTALTMFLGATGPLVAALISVQGFGRETVVATNAGAMTAQHLLKTLVFGIVGFAWADWAPLIAAMVCTGYLGTRAGAGLLRRMPESRFRAAFRIGLTILAANLALQAIRGAS
ncbi:sulfite exporter TauE/SafE family protein [Rhodovulum sp. DZ06]|uniref:sulfite exporter TauE/SafE family protein n=1 Tax=Rhodovulum sp. DZ06 TaxID=3425126 RepID=UPI003D353338